MSVNSIVSEYAVSLPFSISAQGGVSYTENQEKIWADRVLSVVGTAIGERLMRPGFGCAVTQNVFLNLGDSDKDAPALAKKDIYSAFTTFLPLLELVDVTYDSSQTDGSLTFTVIYRLPNKVLKQTNVATIYVDGKSIPVEVS
jgi:phage baseplate assembly protein W